MELRAKASSCCKFPAFFSKTILRKCKSQALVKKENGKDVFYEDSCFLDCVFKTSGHSTKGNLSGQFIRDALPPHSLENPLTIINWYHFADMMMAQTCNIRWFTAGTIQRFTAIYKKALANIDAKRPICNIRIAGFWDCMYNQLMGQCLYEMLTQTDACTKMRTRAVQCTWW
ncbi:general odorant-binding protein 67-like [Culicoides brevitarsis]|uniref:general odorant-binding protein 67-like n=1 Tax=Culicoides brevitarsis TaxID=469753 RepID=UPI00307C00A1